MLKITERVYATVKDTDPVGKVSLVDIDDAHAITLPTSDDTTRAIQVLMALRDLQKVMEK